MAIFARHSKAAVIFIAPQLLLILIFFIWPAGNAIIESFFYSDAFGLHSHFAKLDNFIDLFSSLEYAKAIGVTAILAISVTLLTMALGLSMSVLVNTSQRGKPFYKSLLLWPYAVAPAVAAILWRFLCHPTLGWAVYLLHQMGVEFNYMIYPKQALFVIILAASWQQFSYNFLFFFAALKLVPRSIVEAAIIDGASAWRRFWQIIFPLLSPTVFFLFVMNLIYCFFDTFGIIQIITNGGPEYSTTTLMYKVYQDGFVAMDPGSSSAQSVILMLMVILLTLAQFRYLEKRVHYQ